MGKATSRACAHCSAGPLRTFGGHDANFSCIAFDALGERTDLLSRKHHGSTRREEIGQLSHAFPHQLDEVVRKGANSVERWPGKECGYRPTLTMPTPMIRRPRRRLWIQRGLRQLAAERREKLGNRDTRLLTPWTMLPRERTI